MSYPTRKDLFTAWAKAMVEGATVGKPHYHGTKSRKGMRTHRKKRKKRFLRKRAHRKQD